MARQVDRPKWTTLKVEGIMLLVKKEVQHSFGLILVIDSTAVCYLGKSHT